MRILTALLAATLLTSSVFGQAAQEKKDYFWFRVAPDKTVKFDPETDKVVKTVTHRHGISSDSFLSHSKKEMYLVTGQKAIIEVLDIEKGEIVDEYDFSEEGFIIRVDSVKEVPGNKHWWVRIDRIEKKLDRFVIKEQQWLLFDTEKGEIEKREKELPKAIRSGARISPDGKKWHVFSRGIKIVDPETLKEEGSIDLSKPLYTGMGTLSVRGDDFYDGKNPGAYKMMYTMRDPVKTNRTIMGIIELDMEKMEIAHYEEWGASNGLRSLRYSKDRKIAVGQKGGGFGGGGRGRQSDGVDPEMTLFSMDLSNGKKLRETRIDVRNGLRFSALSPAGDKIYLSGRGHELVVYDANHEYLKTLEMPGELDGRIYVIEE